jgi:hypothetical protein
MLITSVKIRTRPLRLQITRRLNKYCFQVISWPRPKEEFTYGMVKGRLYAWGFLCCFFEKDGQWEQLVRLPGLSWCPSVPEFNIKLQSRGKPVPVAKVRRLYATAAVKYVEG